MKWIIDTDAGVDDAVAFALPFVPGNPYDFDLLAVTTVSGNIPVHKVNHNVGALRTLLGFDAPIHAGADRPLITQYLDASDFHGADGLGDAGLSAAAPALDPEHGALALLRLARAHSGQISILALGPLTNIALACNLDPEFPKHIAKLVIMGGAWRAVGNQTSAGEFNIVADPESAHVVFERFDDRVVLAPWELCIDTVFPYDTVARIGAAGTRRSEFFRAMTAQGMRNLRERFNYPGFPMPDPTAMVVALDESVIKRELRARVHVDIGHDAGRALTSLDFRHAHPNVRVVVDLHFDKAYDMIERAWTL